MRLVNAPILMGAARTTKPARALLADNQPDAATNKSTIDVEGVPCLLAFVVQHGAINNGMTRQWWQKKRLLADSR
jgi:hypothetical protein